MKKHLLPFLLAIFTSQLFGQLSVSISSTSVTCYGGANGSATATPSGGTNHYSYSWAPSGGTNAIATGLSGGTTYTVTLTDTVPGSAGTFTLYTQDFEGAHGWTLNVVTGPQGADPNFWTVSAAEGGVLPPGCGVANNGNKTLHVTSVFNPTGGAAYDAGGWCGVLYCPQASSRAESPAFSTLTYTGTKLEFDYISNGQGLIDNASVWYNSGSGWTLLTNSIKSSTCGGGQGQWTHYTASLPASCDNNASVKVGINWVNNDDGVGTDPSVAINNVLVTGQGSGGPPTLQTATATVTIAQPALITGTQTVSLCYGDSLTVGSNTYSAAGTYVDTLSALNGCDSVLTTNLSIKPQVDVSTTTNVNVITANATPATYQWYNCDSLAIVPGETGQVFNATQDGQYAVIVTQNGCTDTSACIKVANTTGVFVWAKDAVWVYPNPASVQFTVEGSKSAIVDIYDMKGRLVLSKEAYNKTSVEIASLPEGIYQISIRTGDKVITKKLAIIR